MKTLWDVFQKNNEKLSLSLHSLFSFLSLMFNLQYSFDICLPASMRVLSGSLKLSYSCCFGLEIVWVVSGMYSAWPTLFLIWLSGWIFPPVVGQSGPLEHFQLGTCSMYCSLYRLHLPGYYFKEIPPVSIVSTKTFLWLYSVQIFWKLLPLGTDIFVFACYLNSSISSLWQLMQVSCHCVLIILAKSWGNTSFITVDLVLFFIHFNIDVLDRDW